MGLLELFEDVDNPTVGDIIHQACEGVIDPELFRSQLTVEDVADIEAGLISVEYLRCAATSMANRLRLSGCLGRPGNQVN